MGLGLGGVSWGVGEGWRGSAGVPAYKPTQPRPSSLGPPLKRPEPTYTESPWVLQQQQGIWVPKGPLVPTLPPAWSSVPPQMERTRLRTQCPE